MRLVLIALFCYLVSNAGGAPQHRPKHRRGLQKIVGGTDAVAGQIPYQVSVQDISFGYGFHVCGGTVYDETNVITTGLCVDGLDFDDPVTLQVAAGKLDLSLTESNEQVVLLNKIVQHGDFDTFTFINDIALLHLSSSLVFDQFVGAAPMPSEDQVSVGDCQVSGWGLTVEDGSSSNVLQVTTVPVVTDDDCRAVYGDTDVTDEMICAGYMTTGGHDACQGDSGGPLICQDATTGPYLAGIASWGYGCGRVGYPGVYTEITYYIDWLTDNKN